jgi:ubiquinone/menaquinone biosynthesis C-methylase UbiE
MYLPVFYHDPWDREPLIEESAGYRNPRTGFVYPVRDGIPVFLTPGAVEGPNLYYQKLYDRTAVWNDYSARFRTWLDGGGERPRHRAYLDLLELHEESAFLEVAVGAGVMWGYLGRRLHFYGLDVSARMLARCRRQAYRLKLRSRLCQGLAEHLPYPNSSFDCVFHAGGINFFSDPAAALSEMVRVAKPRTRLVVVDETAEAVQKKGAKAFFGDGARKIEPPVALLPPGMREVQVQQTEDGELYVLSFRKP